MRAARAAGSCPRLSHLTSPASEGAAGSQRALVQPLVSSLSESHPPRSPGRGPECS